MGGQTEYAYHYIKENILNGTFKPSQKLTETQLTKEIGVSRNTIKKALMMLERENLVEVEPNKGATIKSLTLEEIVNYFEIRAVLEGLVARKAARHIRETELRKLDEILKQMKVYLDENRFEEYSLLNREFHNVIYGASQNVQAVAIINTLKTQLNRIDFRTILVPGRNQDSYKEHVRILNALKSRQEEEAEEAIKSHVERVCQTIVEHYSILV